jgi:hypothetical protein
MIDIARRLTFFALIFGSPLLLAPDLAEAQAQSVPAPINFVVNRDGTPIGTYRLTFHTEPGPDGERLIVDIAIDIKVRAVFVTVYRYTFKGRETWQGGKLVALDTATDDDGKKLQVHVRATEAGLKVDSTEAHYVAPADTLPESYWRPDTVMHQHFIDIEDGKLVDLISTPAGRRTITYAGQPVELSMYHLAGDIDGEIGYSSGGEWMMLRFPSHGSDILYTREPG